MMQIYAKAAIAFGLSFGLFPRIHQDQGANNQPPTQEPAGSQTSPAEKRDQTRPEERTVPSDSTNQVQKSDAEKGDASPSLPAGSKRRIRARKWTQSPESEPRRTIIRRGGVSEPVTQIVPGMTLEESNRLRQDVKDLLAAADSDLKKLASRTLNANQQETVGQVHHYMDVAHFALNDGDIERAHTLALKAQLLSDDLVKH